MCCLITQVNAHTAHCKIHNQCHDCKTLYHLTCDYCENESVSSRISDLTGCHVTGYDGSFINTAHGDVPFAIVDLDLRYDGKTILYNNLFN